MVRRVGVIFLLLVMLVSCDRTPMPSPVKPDVIEKGDTARRTLLVYMMAENSLNGYTSSDISEIRRAVPQIPSDCRIFVYVDDSDAPKLTHYYRMTDGEVGSVDVDVFTKDVCSSDTAALGVVLDCILDGYPTGELDMVLWSHGDGWLPDYARNSAPCRTIGIDNGRNTNSNLTTRAIEIAELAALLERLPVKVDRLLFDACFMQGVEVAYALRDAVQWVIASPAEIPGDGAPYDSIVRAFFDTDGVEQILENYKAAYEDGYMGVVLSAAYMPAMQRLADETYSNICTYFNSDRKRDYLNVFAYLPGGAQGTGGAMPCYYDANAVMKRYLSDAEYVIWKDALDAAVPYAVTTGSWYSIYSRNRIFVDLELYSGISIYMPQSTSRYSSLNVAFSATEWYGAAGWGAAGW